MDLFFSSTSGNSARAVFGLLESGVDWNPRLVDPRAGETREPGYLALNPMGKVPVLVDGSFTLWESNAILMYACEKHPSANLWPSTITGRASVWRWMLFQAGHVSPACHPIFRATNARIQAFWKIQGDAQAAEAGRKELARYLPVLDSALAGRAWLEGNFTLADVAYAPHFWMLRDGGHDFSTHANVNAWLDRLFARPAWGKTLALVFP